MPSAEEEQDVELALQFRHRFRERWLRNTKERRSARYTSGLRHGNQVLELAQIQRYRLFSGHSSKLHFFRWTKLKARYQSNWNDVSPHGRPRLMTQLLALVRVRAETRLVCVAS
jgi:hypothetical protein